MGWQGVLMYIWSVSVIAVRQDFSQSRPHNRQMMEFHLHLNMLVIQDNPRYL